jgi:eukaryotic-like serine/threonine-protein kinase
VRRDNNDEIPAFAEATARQANVGSRRNDEAMKASVGSPMTPVRLRTIEELFHQALDCEPGQLRAFLDQRCAGDAALRDKVEALLASHRHAERRIETSIAAVAANIVENAETGSLIGQTVGHYKILKRIHAGGMGEVYLASDLIVGRKAALKLLPAHVTGNADRLKRFQQEARVVAGLNHPNILTVYEVGEARSRPYIASELVEGETLRQRLTRGSVQSGDAVEIAIQIAGALAAAHSAGVVHRDVKPENIMLRPDGYVKVVDFGIAKLAESAFAEATTDRQEPMTLVETNLGSLLGTVSYMSPEQAEGAPVDRRTDIWSLGVVLHEMVTRRAPFTGDTSAEVVAAILGKEPPPLGDNIVHAPDELQQIVSKALQKDPAQRFQSANEMLGALKSLRHKLELAAELESRGSGTAGYAWLRWMRAPGALVLAVLIGVFALMFPLYWLGKPQTSSTPEKSIAVLPFENLSRDPDNAFFADGVQDEILTDLAQVADLKVISRTSVMPYKSGTARNIRKIARQLGVAHVVEGSVQRAGDRVRVNAQLVDARTDQHLWAQTYDRQLADVFVIQSEIAKTIATQLQAKLSSREKSAIEQPTTNDITAFDLYNRARNLLLTATDSSTGGVDRMQAIDLLDQAVSRDPSFFQAYCQLARAHIQLYFYGFDRTPTRLELAEAAIQAASRLRPDAGETHFAHARNLYWGHLDYHGALAELEIARQNLPNDALIFQLMGFIQRRQGDWVEATQNLERSVELDPRNTFTLQQMAWHYLFLRRYAEVKSLLTRVLAIEPNRTDTEILLASVDFHWKADIGPLHRAIDAIRAANSSALPSIADAWLTCALAERDSNAAANSMAALGENAFGDDAVQFGRAFVEGVLARMAKDESKAHAAFTAAHSEQERIVAAQPDYGPPWCVLGLIDAALGRKEDALREGRRAVELLPVEKDAIRGAAMIKYLAMIAAWAGDNNLACERLATLIRYPTSPSYGDLKLLPWWDPLRGDPRFEKLVQEAQQPIAPALAAKKAPDKSIAVLPFSDLSQAHNQEYFCDGIQEEIRTRLSKIADLKVISRTSTQHYKSAPENLPEIAKQLGVAHVLEGSVQRSGDAVRVNVQLIKAADDSHLWAETFDRKVTDIFSVENEVAKAIADQLRVKLTGQEEQVIAARPTDNPEAYDAYLRGLAYSLKALDVTPANALGAQKYLREAVRLDPKFALAWALLSYVDARGYVTGNVQRTIALQEEAKQAAETALTLRPDLGEAVVAKGYYHYACLKDYDTAVRYFEQARQFLPNSSRIPESLAYLERRRNEWDRSESFFNEAERLDPRNVSLLSQRAISYMVLRRFPEAQRKLDQVLNITPDDMDTLAQKAAIAQASGDLPQASALLAPLHPNADHNRVLKTQVYQAILERRPEPAIRWLKEVFAKPDPTLGYVNGELHFWLGWAQDVAGDHAAAQESWRQARSELESFLKEQPDNYFLIGDLALTDMGLGNKPGAFTLTEQAMAAVPIEKDPVGGWTPTEILARVAAQMGEPDRAVAALRKLLSLPYEGALAGTPLTPALLRLDPMFDPLRNDPRFQMLAGAAPK